MLKKRILMLIMALVTMIIIPTQALAQDYDYYNIYATGTDSGYTTNQLLRTGSTDHATNNLITNTSTHALYMRVNFVDPWTVATDYRWQTSGTTLYYNYNSSFINTMGYYKLYFRRNTDDTYAGARHVGGRWFVQN